MEHWVELGTLHFYQLEMFRESSQGNKRRELEAIAYGNYAKEHMRMCHMRIRMA